MIRSWFHTVTKRPFRVAVNGKIVRFPRVWFTYRLVRHHLRRS